MTFKAKHGKCPCINRSSFVGIPITQLLRDMDLFIIIYI